MTEWDYWLRALTSYHVSLNTYLITNFSHCVTHTAPRRSSSRIDAVQRASRYATLLIDLHSNCSPFLWLSSGSEICIRLNVALYPSGWKYTCMAKRRQWPGTRASVYQSWPNGRMDVSGRFWISHQSSESHTPTLTSHSKPAKLQAFFFSFTARFSVISFAFTLDSTLLK